MRTRRLSALLGCLALALAAQPASASADHVSANPEVSARLGERTSSQSWAVIVDWSINCTGAASPSNYGGSLNLVDVDTGEEIYMGGTFAPSGSDRQLVGRRPLPRRLRPKLKAFCSDATVGSSHGSGTVEVTGNVVTVPARGDEDGDGQVDPPAGGGGGGGGSDGPRDPLRSGGCATQQVGTPGADKLNGTAGPDLIFGLGGSDTIRGLGGDDCLIGENGADRLFGQGGFDRLTGGRGNDYLDGGRGINRYDAGAGNDRVLAANGRRNELVSCGSGRDRARVDRGDRVRRCETVIRVR